MDEYIALLQQLQDTYASDTGICLLVTDGEGRGLTRPSGKAEWLRPLEDRNEAGRLSPEAMALTGSFEGLSRPIEYEFRPGIKLMAMPIPGRAPRRFYLWAAFFTDSRARLLLQSYYEGEESEGALYRELRDSVPELNGERKRQLSAKLGAMASITGRLMQTDTEQTTGKRQLAAIREISAGLDRPENRLKDSLQPFFALGDGLDFLGLAFKQDETRFQVVEVLGEGFSLSGSSFSLGEGFLGQTAATRQAGRWGNVSRDPRILFFRQNNVQVKALFSYPLVREGEIIGILFGGSRSLTDIPDAMYDFGQTLCSILSSQFVLRSLREDRNAHFMRLSMLMEISRTVTMVQDLKRVLFILIDMSLSLVEGPFAAALLTRTGGKAQMVSRGLSHSQVEASILELSERYETFEPEDPFYGRAVLTEIQGVPVLECPLVYRYELLGVLLVALRHRGHFEEYRDFMMALSIAVSGAIHRIREDERPRGYDSPALLHLAMKQWDADAYERTLKARDLAAEFARSRGLTEREERLTGEACMLSGYDPELVKNEVEPELAVILDELSGLTAADGELDLPEPPQPEQTQPRKETSQIAALALGSVQAEPKLGTARIRADLLAAFTAFLTRKETVDLEVTLGETAAARDDLAFRGDPLQAIRDMHSLSSREQEVLSLVATGASNRDVAETLFISEHTVKNHMTNIFHKLGVNDRSQLIAMVYQLGYNHAYDPE
ncbi:LuxR C-terminal-related transcriptional regulator [Gorillibacterium timonense]|uniref:LuxR C-terminal-related transcriptional regulator n=1 Tax=Gorillibacterium timonense TaxID=1689269 RepID=UPI00071D6079|nr:LuxR C-terminal-related transcriptional regulator [Gorillibacterium timonense]